jgi:spermidine/putrescine transport system substrate-binding protein
MSRATAARSWLDTNIPRPSDHNRAILVSERESAMHPTTGRVNRREFIGASALALAAAACGGTTSAGGSNTPSTIASTAKMEDKLNIYNWAQYINPKNLNGFKAAFPSLHVSTGFFASNEQLLTQLTTTKGQQVYDIIVPDADHVHIEKGLGLLKPLNHALIPNLKYLDKYWTQTTYDPGNVYSVVKDTGITGFTMRTDTVKADLKSWKDFFDFLPHASGLKVNFIESPAEVIGVALNSLGYSLNSEDDSQLNQAQNLLLNVRPYVDTINEVYINDFSAGNIDLGITYSGDGIRIRTARKAQNDIKVVAPQGRSEIWTDNWAISAYAPDPVAAHAFINYILEPKHNAFEMEYNQLEVGTPASFKYVGAAAHDPLVVFGPEILNDYEVLRTTPQGLQKRITIWDKFKAG